MERRKAALGVLLWLSILVPALCLAHATLAGEVVRDSHGLVLFPDPHPDRHEGEPLPQAGDPRLLRLTAVEPFDPVRRLPRLDDVLPTGPTLAPSPGRYRIVQLRQPPTAARQHALRDAGAEILGYLPNRALVVRAGRDVTDKDLARIAGVRSVSPFQRGYNLSPGLFRTLRRADSMASGSPSTLDVSLFRGQDAVVLAGELQRRFPGVHVRHLRPELRGEPATLMLEVPAATLAHLVGSLLGWPVAWVERRAPLHLYNDHSVWIGQSYDRTNGPGEAGEPDPKPYALSAPLWNRGLTGTGQIVAVADAELEHGMCFWNDPEHPVIPQSVPPPAPLTVDPAHRKILALNGTNPQALATTGSFRHGTHVAGIVAGDDLAHPAGTTTAGHDHGDGMAPDARIVFEDISVGITTNCLGATAVLSIGDLLEQEYAAGARIATNSWGGTDSEFGGNYTARTREIDAAVWTHEDFLVLFAAGNSGPSGFSDYAAAKDAVAVGASENWEPDHPGALDPENVPNFSSHGPAADGRLKPDLMAPGDRVFSSRYRSLYVDDETDPHCTNPDPGVEVCFPTIGIGGCYLTFTEETCTVRSHAGTSMSAPMAAGLAALARQYFTDGFYPGGAAEPADAFTPSAALLKAILVSSARTMTGENRGSPLAEPPTNVQGWGRVTLDDALYFTGDTRHLALFDVANADGLATGETFSTGFGVISPGEPLKLTLVWTDPPALPAASPALVNDLDLELVALDGTRYQGNVWTADDPGIPGDRESLPDPAERDATNSVEGILLRSPPSGRYALTVRGVNVPGHLGVMTQGYALVVTGAVVDEGPAGAVPDGRTVSGTPLMADPAADGDITLSWGGSCIVSDDDYEIYEGDLGNFASHIPRFCSTGGATTWTFTPTSEHHYYIVVPVGGDREGSFGVDGDGDERPRGPAPCRDQVIGVCP